MISKQKIELVRSLANKKGREETGLFVAEGEKIVFDLLKTRLRLSAFYYTIDATSIPPGIPSMVQCNQLTSKEMERISAFKKPSSVLALFEIPSYPDVEPSFFEGLTLFLDGIQDPGNLGTIVRTADWFGISNIYCSPECADIYNPKCVQSTMGALARVRLHYTELTVLTRKAVDLHIPVYGTFMEGENLFKASLAPCAIIIMGSEGKGISSDLVSLVTKKISIPASPEGNKELESLNVAVSAAIVCAEFRRRQDC